MNEKGSQMHRNGSILKDNLLRHNKYWDEIKCSQMALFCMRGGD